jgi:phosphatidate phosphatase APP1
MTFKKITSARGWILRTVALMMVVASPTATLAGTETGVISGFDDVLRQADLPNPLSSAWRLLTTDEGFAGMPTLYKALVPAAENFVIISGITSLYGKTATRFLRAEGYPPFQLRFRNWLTEWPIAAFKMNAIRDVVWLTPERRYVFIFDNSAPSLKIARELRSTLSSYVAAIYLRQTTRQNAAPGTTAFVTALDIALAEFAAGRLPEAKVAAVARVLLAEANTERIIPSYAYCPLESAPTLPRKLGRASAKLCLAVAQKVRDFCRARRP